MFEVPVKKVPVSIGPRGNRQGYQIKLNGVAPDEPLTPKMARRACRAAGANEGVVWEEDYSYGYRVYQNSARKIFPNEPIGG